MRGADFFYKYDPKQEKHTVESVLEEVIVEEIKPRGMVLYQYGYQEDTQDVKGMAAKPSKRYEPEFAEKKGGLVIGDW